MIFWKEWRRLRGRFFSLAGFYLITVLLGDVEVYSSSRYHFEGVASAAITWGAMMILIPAILGMDAWAGERDEGTEPFLFSKPMSLSRLWVAKIGLRLILTFLLTGLLILLLVLRTAADGFDFFWGVRPFISWYLLLSVGMAELLVLMTTVWVSLRAPYQSTALIIGAALGGVIASWPLVSSLRPIESLQVPWENFGLLALMFALVTFAAAWGYAHREPGRSLP